MLTSLRPATTSAPCIYEILVLQKRLVKTGMGDAHNTHKGHDMHVWAIMNNFQWQRMNDKLSVIRTLLALV